MDKKSTNVISMTRDERTGNIGVHDFVIVAIFSNDFFEKL